MKFSIEQLKYADEICWDETAKNLFKKHLGDDWAIHYLDFTGVRNEKCSFIQWIFSNSRSYTLADNRELGNKIDVMLTEIIGTYDPSK